MNPGAAVLYVPADNERALAKALHTDASALIFDLEDAVAPAVKDRAREMLRAAWARKFDRPRGIRINGIDTPRFTDDLLLARKLMPDAIVLPKVERAADLATIEAALAETDAGADLRIWAMIETPLGVLNVTDIAAHGGRLAGLVLGSNDLIAALGASGDGARTHLDRARLDVVLATRAHGLIALDGVTNALRDEAMVEREARAASALGFDGKTLIHPAQIEPTLRAFLPTDDEVRDSRAVVAAFEAAPDDAGAATVNGRLVERLHLAAARRVLSRIGDPE